MLTAEEIEESISCLSGIVARLAAGDGDLSPCIEANERFRALRDQYRQHPDTLVSRVPQLSELSRRFEDLLAARLPAAVDRFHQVIERIRQAEKEKEFWREFFIRTVETTRQAQLKGATAIVHVRSLRSRTLPPAGSHEREQLESLIRQSGHWEQVSQLSRPKLQRAVYKKALPDTVAASVDQLCPVRTVHQISTRRIGGPPSSG